MRRTLGYLQVHPQGNSVLYALRAGGLRPIMYNLQESLRLYAMSGDTGLRAERHPEPEHPPPYTADTKGIRPLQLRLSRQSKVWNCRIVLPLFCTALPVPLASSPHHNKRTSTLPSAYFMDCFICPRNPPGRAESGHPHHKQGKSRPGGAASVQVFPYSCQGSSSHLPALCQARPIQASR